MPVDYINIIDRVWGHLNLDSGNKCGAEDKHVKRLYQGITTSLGEDKKGRDVWAPPGQLQKSIHYLKDRNKTKGLSGDSDLKGF